MRKAGKAKPHNRDGVWYLVRRVPAEFAHLDRRGLVRISTNIAVADDPRAVRATETVRILGGELDAYWRIMRDGQSAEARIRFEAAQARARALGFVYQTAPELAAGPLQTILDRIDNLLRRDVVEDELDVAAVLGGEKRPALRLSGLLTEFEALQRSSLEQMSPDQVRRWRNPKRRAIDNFLAVIGDKDLAEVSRADAVAFRRWWQNRITAEDLDIATANKDFSHLSKMLHTVDMAHELGLKRPFSRLRMIVELALVHEGVVVGVADPPARSAGALDELNDELAAGEVEGDGDLRRGVGSADQFLGGADAGVHLPASEHEVLLGRDREAGDVVIRHLRIEGPAEGGVEGGRALDAGDGAGDEEAHAHILAKYKCDGKSHADKPYAALTLSPGPQHSAPGGVVFHDLVNPCPTSSLTLEDVEEQGHRRGSPGRPVARIGCPAVRNLDRLGRQARSPMAGRRLGRGREEVDSTPVESACDRR